MIMRAWRGSSLEWARKRRHILYVLLGISFLATLFVIYPSRAKRLHSLADQYRSVEQQKGLRGRNFEALCRALENWGRTPSFLRRLSGSHRVTETELLGIVGAPDLTNRMQDGSLAYAYFYDTYAHHDSVAEVHFDRQGSVAYITYGAAININFGGWQPYLQSNSDRGAEKGGAEKGSEANP